MTCASHFDSPITTLSIIKKCCLSLVLLIVLGTTQTTSADTFVVNSTDDTSDDNPGDATCVTQLGTCTLRAAIEEANALAGLDIIELPAGHYMLTLGHLDIITRSSTLYDQVIVVVSRNPTKNPMFTIEERLAQIRKATEHLDNVEIDSFDGLTVNYAHQRQAKVLIRGLRVFLKEYEVVLSCS